MGAAERAILKGFFCDLLAMHDPEDVNAAMKEALKERDGGKSEGGLSKFLKMSDNLQLVRFRGPDFVKLVGRTPAHDGVPPQCYEILVDKRPGGCKALCLRNAKTLFQIEFPFSSCLLEAMAVSAFHRWYKDTRAANRRGRDARKRAKKLKEAS